MKAKDFLNLVRDARNEARSFYKKKNYYPIQAQGHLVKAKVLEKLIDAVVLEGKLEPDEVDTAGEQESFLQMILDAHGEGDEENTD